MANFAHMADDPGEDKSGGPSTPYLIFPHLHVGAATLPGVDEGHPVQTDIVSAHKWWWKYLTIEAELYLDHTLGTPGTAVVAMQRRLGGVDMADGDELELTTTAPVEFYGTYTNDGWSGAGSEYSIDITMQIFHPGPFSDGSGTPVYFDPIIWKNGSSIPVGGTAIMPVIYIYGSITIADGSEFSYNFSTIKPNTTPATAYDTYNADLFAGDGGGSIEYYLFAADGNVNSITLEFNYSALFSHA